MRREVDEFQTLHALIAPTCGVACPVIAVWSTWSDRPGHCTCSRRGRNESCRAKDRFASNSSSRLHYTPTSSSLQAFKKPSAHSLTRDRALSAPQDVAIFFPIRVVQDSESDLLPITFIAGYSKLETSRTRPLSSFSHLLPLCSFAFPPLGSNSRLVSSPSRSIRRLDYS
jgi:hypothetical protein